MTCGLNPRAATETVSIAAGSSFTFKVDNGLGHPGPAAIYLGQVPSGQTAASWNGSGAQWFKIAEWGAKFNPFGFLPDGRTELSASIPSKVPNGEVRTSSFQTGSSRISFLYRK
jgi:Auxiliary Activity family 9 (formerly GH61)